MKICILQSSYEGSANNCFPEVYQDPSVYGKTLGHEFSTKYITKKNGIKQIDQAIQESYDFYWHFLWGREQDNVAGINELKYLESCKVPIIGPSSKYLEYTKLDCKTAAKNGYLNVPNWIILPSNVTISKNNGMDHGLNYPVIVKHVDGFCSMHMTKNSVCDNEDQLIEEIGRQRSLSNADLLIEEFIIGLEVACMLFEQTNKIIALPPIYYEFPKDCKDTECWLDWDFKMANPVKYKYLDENKNDDLIKKIQNTCINLYILLGLTGCSYGRVDLRIDKYNTVYIIEINPTPAIFLPSGNNFREDGVIIEKYPGGHEALVKTIIDAKLKI